MTTAILIPARLNSTRFPNKMFAKLQGKTLIEHVYEKCKNTKYDTYVLTEDREIKNLIPNSILTPKCSNGTERCMRVIDADLRYDRYINVQGDMPDISPRIIESVEKSLEHHDISTAYTPMSRSRRQDPNSVKLIHSGGYAHWFCRASLNYGDHHIGVYGYTKESKVIYENSIKYKEEELEQLEQLRWIQNNVKIGVTCVEFDGIEINTALDLELWQQKN